MASADWMPRNLERRVEILFPILQEDLKQKAIHVLQVQLDDTLKAHILQPDDSYAKVDRRGKRACCAQDTFCEEAIAQAQEEKKDDITASRIFKPEVSQHLE